MSTYPELPSSCTALVATRLRRPVPTVGPVVKNALTEELMPPARVTEATDVPVQVTPPDAEQVMVKVSPVLFPVFLTVNA